MLKNLNKDIIESSIKGDIEKLISTFKDKEISGGLIDKLKSQLDDYLECFFLRTGFNIEEHIGIEVTPSTKFGVFDTKIFPRTNLGQEIINEWGNNVELNHSIE